MNVVKYGALQETSLLHASNVYLVQLIITVWRFIHSDPYHTFWIESTFLIVASFKIERRLKKQIFASWYLYATLAKSVSALLINIFLFCFLKLHYEYYLAHYSLRLLPLLRFCWFEIHQRQWVIDLTTFTTSALYNYVSCCWYSVWLFNGNYCLFFMSPCHRNLKTKDLHVTGEHANNISMK